MRALAEIEEGARSDRIVITELPYQVGPNAVLSKIKELVASREIEESEDGTTVTLEKVLSAPAE